MKRLIAISLIVLTGLLLSACSTSTSTTSWPGLAADKDRAYLANAQFVYAVRLSDAGKLWQYPKDKAGTEEYFSNPVLASDGQHLLIASAGKDSALISLDPATGAEKWGAPFVAPDHWVASPLVVGDMIYAPNNNGRLYAISLATGKEAWSLSVGRSLWASPTTDGKLIFVSSLDHSLYAVDPNLHKVVWHQDLGGPIPGSPLVISDGNSLYVGSFARKVYALESATGTIRWKADLKDWVWSTPTLLDNALYAADISGNVYSLDATNGKNSWAELKPDGPVTASPVIIPNGVAVATESGSLYAYKPDGSALWSPVNIGGKIYTTPVLAGDRLLVATMGAEYWLYAVNVKDGSLAPWHFGGK